MNTFFNIMRYVLCGLFLACAFVTDKKRREIPNWIPAGIVLAGIFGLFAGNWLYQIVSGLLFGLFELVSSRFVKHGEGDIRISVALAFAIGIVESMIALVVGSIATVIYYKFVKKTRITKNTCYPLGCALFVGYIVYIIAFGVHMIC